MNVSKLLRPIADKSAFLYNTFLATISNPNKLAAQYGDREVTLDNIKEDPHVSAVMQARKAGVLSLEYNIVLNENNMQYKELFEYIIDTINLHKFVEMALDAVFYGFEVMEISWRYENFQDKLYLIPYAITEKPRNWFTFNNNNMLVLNNIDKEYLPAYKFILIQHKPTYLNPYGESVLSKCLWPVVFKKSAFTFWTMMAEKLGVPHLVGKTDAILGTDSYNAFLDALDDLIQDGSMVISTQDQVETINPATAVNVEIFQKLIDTANTEISKAILSQTLTTEIGDTGSYAASQTHLEVKKELEESDKDLIEDALNKLFEWIAKFNLPNEIEVPYISLYRAIGSDNEASNQIATQVDLLTRNNQIKFKKEFYMNKFGFTEDEFEILDTQPTPAPAFDETVKTNINTDTNVNTNFDNQDTPWDQILIDTFGDKAFADNPDILQSAIDVMQNYIDKQNSYEDAIKNITDIMPGIDLKELEDKLTRILFVSNIVGRLSVNEELKNGK